MRQSEYTTFYERRGRSKYPVRGKLYMRYRGLSIYVRNGDLTEGRSGIGLEVTDGVGKADVKKYIDAHYDAIFTAIKEQGGRVHWRSMEGGVLKINGKVVQQNE